MFYCFSRLPFSPWGSLVCSIFHKISSSAVGKPASRVKNARILHPWITDDSHQYYVINYFLDGYPFWLRRYVTLVIVRADDKRISFRCVRFVHIYGTLVYFSFFFVSPTATSFLYEAAERWEILYIKIKWQLFLSFSYYFYYFLIHTSFH